MICSPGSTGSARPKDASRTSVPERVTRKPALLDLLERRLPSQGENSPNNPDFVGNPQLRPESTLTVDVGIELDTRRLGAAHVQSP